jgi:hypothetical protein
MMNIISKSENSELQPHASTAPNVAAAVRAFLTPKRVPAGEAEQALLAKAHAHWVGSPGKRIHWWNWG